MPEDIRHRIVNQLNRRARSGLPWWVYGVSLATANGIRQVVLWRLDATTAPKVISFVAMVFGVIALLDGLAALHRRRQCRRAAQPGRAAGMAPTRR
jgi:hypothetical protein